MCYYATHTWKESFDGIILSGGFFSFRKIDIVEDKNFGKRDDLSAGWEEI